MNDPGAALREAAQQLGFDRVAIARADLPLDADFAHYESFLAQGMHGTMSWLANHRDVRRALHCPEILPGARSVVCVAQRYAIRSGDDDPGLLPRIARYARGRDYHNHFRRRLRKLADLIRTMAPGTLARPMVDTAPVLERAWASRAGLGFVGKNGMLIVPGMGSFVTLGEVVTTLELLPDPGEPMPSRCGRCTRCLDACPTRAFAGPYLLDARRCIAYLTIEHHGPMDAALAGGVTPWFFGCDRCQEVCPYNKAPDAYAEPGSAFDPLDRWGRADFLSLAAVNQQQWEALSEGTPLRRTSAIDMKRNVLLALGGTTSADALEVRRVMAMDADNPAWLRELARVPP